VDLRKAPQAGGVAVVIADIVRSRDALWFGWNGETTDTAGADVVHGDGRVKTVALSQSDYEGYYLGYSNSVLWPVFHNRLDLAQFEAGFFEQYLDVNKRLARLLKPMLRTDDVIWVHDYHLIPFGTELRKLGLQNPIGYFLHIPFPPWQTFMAIPEHQQLARNLAAYDLVGLQTKADVLNLFDYLQHGVHGRIVPDGRIRLFDRLVSIGSFPVGIDLEDFADAKRATGLVQARPSASRIIGIDRLDYTKGLPQKFRAFGRFLEKYPNYRRKVVLTQIAPPTRASVEAYADIRQQLEALAGSTNGRFGELDWVPIHYIHRSTPRRRLRDLYRSSRIALVTPLRDGMNLVAQEYVAAQDPNDPGVLILSQFAGAAEDLTDALIVNPYNIEETADAIRIALEMSRSERVARYEALLAAVRKHDCALWCESFLDRLRRAREAEQLEGSWSTSEPIRSAFQKLEQAHIAARAEPIAKPTTKRPVTGKGLTKHSDTGKSAKQWKRVTTMKIAQIAPLVESVPPRFYGGTERIVSYLTEELVAQGHDVTLFASGQSITSARLVPCCAQPLRLNPAVRDPIPYYMVMMDRVRSLASEFDILHFHTDQFHFPLFREMAHCTLTTLHGRQDLPGLKHLYAAFPDMRLVSVSNSQRKPVAGANFIATVYHGIPAHLHSPTLDPRGGYLAFLGRISHEKRVDLAIAIARAVGLPLKIAAKVDRADEDYFKEIAPLLKQPGVEFIGEIDERQKTKFLGEASALLFPIDWPEPFGLVMIEAMACGTPVLAFRKGSVPEVVEDGITGFAVDSVDEAICKMGKILALDRRAVRRRFEERFTAARMAADYLRIYRQLLRHVSSPADTPPVSERESQPSENGSVESVC
jgi:trehalose 6-phosphate synthase